MILAASLVVGQGVFALCGRREWSWLAPAVGLARAHRGRLGHGAAPRRGARALVAIAVLVLASLALPAGESRAPRRRAHGLPVAVAALLAASLPFIVEGRFGILGTGLNPDMSQHLFAADALAHGEGWRLLEPGYPLGPHSLVVATARGPARASCTRFDGLMLAIAVCAALAPLALLGGSPWRRVGGALLVGLPYMVASYLIQGAFKETMEALFVLAFAIGLHELRAGGSPGAGRASAPRRTGAVPLAALAVGAVYSYSFPGLLWLAGAAGLWALVELALVAAASPAAAVALVRRAALAPGSRSPPVALAVAPEIGRMVDFASFETFDPSGRRARQPLQPDLAARGARDLAVGRLPPRPGRWCGAGRRLLPRRAARPGGAWPTGWPGGFAAASGRCRRRSPWRRSCSPTRTSRARRTRRRRRS